MPQQADLSIEIPYSPRPLQAYLHQEIARKRWSCLVLHRRAGKSVMCINHLIRDAINTTQINARYAFLTGTYKQAKSIMWDYLKQYTAVIPGTKYHETELRCDLPNGARIELLGADNYQTLRGRYFDGIVLDEFADMPEPVLPEIVRPALSDRKGYMIAIGTPRGHNAFYELYREAVNSSDTWFSYLAGAASTKILPDDELEAAKTMMSTDSYAQEFECSWVANIPGSIWGKELQRIEDAGQITKVPHDPAHAVHTSFDLGVADATSIWFYQLVGKAIHIIDFYEERGEGLPFFARVLDERGYKYGRHYAPHDIAVREMGTGRSRLEIARDLGISFRVGKKLPVEDGLHAASMIVGKCWFDRLACEHGLEALRHYHRAYNERTRSYRMTPVHDWSSHAADAFRYMAISIEDDARFLGRAPQKHAEMDYQVFA
jgi:hypothetical protein